MSSDIPPLMPVPSPPLVREKRRYHGERKPTDDEQSDNPSTDERQPEESDDNLQHKPAENKNNNKVGHIDEYV